MIKTIKQRVVAVAKAAVISALWISSAAAQTNGWHVSIPGPPCSATYFDQYYASPYGCWTSAECVGGSYYRDIYGVMGAASCECQYGATLTIDAQPTMYTITGNGSVLPNAIYPFPVYAYNTISCDMSTYYVGHTAFQAIPNC